MWAAKSCAGYPHFQSMDALQLAAACELIGIMKQESISIDMSDYFGFEKVGSLRKSLTTIALLQLPVHWITIRYTK